MEIKVKCICGSNYSFEEVPVNGRVAFPVSCTNCGADGTEKANQYIARELAGEPHPVEKSRHGLRLFGFGRRKDEGDENEVATAPRAEDESGDETSKARILLAIAGAALVGAIGAFARLQLAKATGFEFGYAAWAIGGLVGGASRLFAPRGHYWLGPTAALAAFLSIGGGQVLVTKWLLDEEINRTLPIAYEQERSFAKEAVEAESDGDLRDWLIKYGVSAEAPAGGRQGTIPMEAM